MESRFRSGRSIPVRAEVFLAPAVAASMAFAGPAPDRAAFLLSRKAEILDLAAVGFPGARFVLYHDSTASSPTRGLEACIVEVPPGAGSFRVADVRKEAAPAEIYPSLADAKTLALLNGGFFGYRQDGSYMPLGLVKSESRALNPPHPWRSGGVLFEGENGLGILPISRFRDGPAVKAALQSKPMLVAAGQDAMRRGAPDRHDRSAIGLAADGTLVLAVLHEPGGRAATLNEFSRFLLGLRVASGSAIQDALAMDGGSSAHLYIPPLRRHCGFGLPGYVPNVVLVGR